MRRVFSEILETKEIPPEIRTPQEVSPEAVSWRAEQVAALLATAFVVGVESLTCVRVVVDDRLRLIRGGPCCVDPLRPPSPTSSPLPGEVRPVRLIKCFHCIQKSSRIAAHLAHGGLSIQRRPRHGTYPLLFCTGHLSRRKLSQKLTCTNPSQCMRDTTNQTVDDVVGLYYCVPRLPTPLP